LEYPGVDAVLPNCQNISAAVKIYHGFRGYADAAEKYGVGAFALDLETESVLTLES
jgi:hypothetical protein